MRNCLYSATLTAGWDWAAFAWIDRRDRYVSVETAGLQYYYHFVKLRSGQRAARMGRQRSPLQEDVLASVSLPGWSLFDALFTTSHDHSEGESSSADSYTQTPIARIKGHRRRAVWTLAVICLGCTLVRLYSSPHPHVQAGGASEGTPEQLPGQEATFFQGFPYLDLGLGWRSSMSQSRRGRANLRSSKPRGKSRPRPPLKEKQRAPPARFNLLKSFVEGTVSEYDPKLFIVPSPLLHASDLGGTASPDARPPIYAGNLVSAVLVNTPEYHHENVRLIAQMVARYPFVREIIVWNNDVANHLSSKVSGRGDCPYRCRVPLLNILSTPLANWRTGLRTPSCLRTRLRTTKIACTQHPDRLRPSQPTPAGP